MKKAMVLIMVLALLVGGCGLKQTINSALCTPTEQQKTAADVGIALVQAALAGAGTAMGNPLLTALSTQVKPVFETVVSGYCVTQAAWNNAVQQLEAAQTQPATAKSMGRAVPNVNRAFADLYAVSWPK